MASGRFDEYWLCVHPACDSLRLKNKTDFLFIRLLKGAKTSADLIVKLENEEYQPLVLKEKKGKIQIKAFVFDPGENDRIHAHRWHQQWRFKDDEGRRFRWITELRKEKSLAIAHRIGSNASRVGFDEFEWLRGQGSG